MQFYNRSTLERTADKNSVSMNNSNQKALIMKFLATFHAITVQVCQIDPDRPSPYPVGT